MKLLYLVPAEVFTFKTSRYRFDYVSALGRDPKCRTHTSGPGWPDWDAGLSPAENVKRLRVDGEPACAVLTYKVRNLRDVKIPVILAYNEADDQHDVRWEIADCGASLVCFHHDNDVLQYRDLADRGITTFHVPHSADPEMFRDYGADKTTDILVVGNLQAEGYPFRNRLSRLAVKHFRKRGYRVEILPHPGYTLPAREGTFVGEGYARKLNAAKVVFTCSSRWKYQFAKYVEIAMSRSLAVGDMPDECVPCRGRLDKMLLRVEPWMTDVEIVRTVEDVLDDPAELSLLTTSAHDTATRDLTTARYAERFLAVVQPFVERCQEETRREQERAWAEEEEKP